MKNIAPKIPAKKSQRMCSNGHTYYKSSECPVCPTCENQQKTEADFRLELSAPARRALEKEGITTLKKLSSYTEKYLLSLHGFGPATIPKLKEVLTQAGLSFAK